MQWIRTTKSLPCPICNSVKYCSIAAEIDLICCMKVESNRPCKSGGWFHKQAEPMPEKKYHIRKAKERPNIDFESLNMTYRSNLKSCEGLALQLGVSERSLYRLGVGTDGVNTTFPMFDAYERVIGIRLRTSTGKICVKGSRNGLFWPQDVYKDSPQDLFICEGESDTGALLDLGFDAIGRPGCLGGTELIQEFLAPRKRDVVIVSDSDEAGIEGSKKLAKKCKRFCKSLKIIKPPRHKDIREWKRAGATKNVIECVVRNTERFK